MSGIQILAAEAIRPVPFAILDEARAAADRIVPDGLLELCGARIRMLMSRPLDSDDPRCAALADYANSPLYSDLERRAIEFTEQWVMDIASMPDDLVAALERMLGPAGLYGFVLGLYAAEQSERLALSAAIHPGVGASS